MNETKNINDRKAALESQLSKICGVAIEITIRGLSRFTISAAGNVKDAMQKAKAFLMLTNQLSDWSVDYDEECAETYAYFKLSTK
jgi:hypothetical protein